MKPNIEKTLLNAIPFLIIALIFVRFFNSSVFEALSSGGNEEIKEFVKKSLSWGICFGAIIAIFIKYLVGVLKINNN